jgi:hypothetical protein
MVSPTTAGPYARSASPVRPPGPDYPAPQDTH